MSNGHDGPSDDQMAEVAAELARINAVAAALVAERGLTRADVAEAVAAASARPDDGEPMEWERILRDEHGITLR